MKFLFFLNTFLFFILTSSALAKIPDQPTNYVTDEANLLSDEEESILNDTLKNYERRTSNQLFILLASSTYGEDYTELTNNIATRWKVGQQGKDNGILIALYLEDRKLRIEVGYGLEASVTDAIASNIREFKINPLLKEENYFEALMTGVQALKEASQGAYSIQHYSEAYLSPQDEIARNQKYYLLGSSGLVIVFSVITFFVHFRRFRKWKKEYAIHQLTDTKKEAPIDKTKNYFLKWFFSAVLYGGFLICVLCYFLQIGGDYMFFIPMLGIFIILIYFILNIIIISTDGFVQSSGTGTYSSNGQSSFSSSRSSSSSSSSFSGGGGGRFGGGGSGGGW